jgi:catechol 2,3-dioxygenase-like lactoylglutathione lyase family enzyme
MFLGVDHAGIGVSNMEKAFEFWVEKLGFTEVFFDYTGAVPGLEEITKRNDVRARIVMLGNRNTTRLGPGKVKLVQRLDGAGAPPLPLGIGYGEVGLAEVCLHTRKTHEIFRHLVDDLKCEPLMTPVTAAVPPHDISLEIGYVADPWRGKVELIDWTGLWTSRPGEPRVEGVNHVAFGVHDMKITTDFYKQFGFVDQIFESKEFFERGHVGPMDFGIGVPNIKKGVQFLKKIGVEMHSDIQTLDVGDSEFKYVYFKDPDDQYVSLVETSY